MHTWDVSLGDRRCAIEASTAPNGKLMVRANGKLVTPPIAADEQQREFELEWFRFQLVRDGASWRLEELGELPMPEIVTEPAPPKSRALPIATMVFAVLLMLFCFGYNAALRRVAALDARIDPILSVLRFALRVVTFGSLAMGVAVFFRGASFADRLATFGGWLLVSFVALALLYGDAMVHNQPIARAGALHTIGFGVLFATAALAGLAQWCVARERAL